MNHHHTPHGDTHTKFFRSRRLHIAVTVLLTGLILVNMALIFFFSSESGDESGDRSAGVTDMILEIICPDYDRLPQAEQQAMLTRMHHLVRKTAHFLEYALLGFLITCLLVYLSRFPVPKIQVWHTWVLPAGFCLLYAASDEIHQIFSGRGPRVTDVLIDFAGAVFGIACLHLCVWLIGRICEAIKHRKEGKEAL